MGLLMLAMHDVLTGIYNRGAIIGHLEAQLARTKRHNQPLAVVMLDVDHFKQLNDTHGHLAGDAVLKTVAARMRECLREYDSIGRYGGEEFLVVLDGADRETSVKAAENCAELDPDKIIAAADKELYRAKSNGRNRVEACRI